MNLPDEVPAKIAMKYAMSEFKRPRGKPRTTWVSQITKDLEQMNVSMAEAENLCSNELKEWQNLIKNFAYNV